MLNNIIERDSYNEMPIDITINNKTINSVDAFKKLTNGFKLKFVERKKYFDNLMPDFERKIRNAIGHENWEYDPYEHMVKYGEDEIYLLEFVYKCWKMFEKVISIYKIVQDVKLHRKLAIKDKGEKWNNKEG
ncbi:hypothetical protein [Anaerosporobacter sp.]|uniref:hypothetical protein n=1 Tax=Anaerosporobacter sp. TaxID=1872529 RepID=UPI00286EDCF8|nr:hypothetical protein [Anaerosporobacter sp.]